MGRIIAVANQKGGVAKTTTATTVASALAEAGNRVLVVDLDAQACATFSLGIDPEDLPLNFRGLTCRVKVSRRSFGPRREWICSRRQSI